MVGTWTYDHTTNVITVTGGTAGAPCTFLDSWNADKGGTFEVEHLRTITGVDANPVVTAHTLRPTDYVELGGACNDLYITVSAWTNMADATIHIVGLDRCAVAVTEDVVVNAAGSYFLMGKYASITSTQVTVYNPSAGGSSFKYVLVQGQWGVVWKQGAIQYKLDCLLQIGDAIATATYFTDTNKEIILNYAGAAYASFFVVKANATLTLGVATNTTTKTTKSGCSVYSTSTGTGQKFHGDASSLIYLYSCAFSKGSAAGWNLIYLELLGSGSRLWNCVLTSDVAIYTPTGVDVYNVTSQHDGTGVACIAYPSPDDTVFEGLTLTDWAVAVSVSYRCTIKNSVVKAATTLCGINTDSNRYWNFVNVESNVWTFTWAGGVTPQKVYRQYTFDLQVLTKDGAAIGTAVVILKDVAGNTIFNVNTDANGNIVQQTVSRGYYAQATGNVLQEYSPHTLTVTKAGYQTYTHVLTLDEKIDWRVTLYKRQDIFINIDGVKQHVNLNLNPTNPENNIILGL